MTLTATKWSLDDYHRMIEAGILCDRPVELLNGAIIDMSPEGEPHASISTDAGEYLMQVLGDLAQVRSAKPITLPSSTSEPEPDLAIVQRLGREYPQHHPYPENIFWVIEYSNTSLSKDQETKSQIYADAEIQEYWIVNLKTSAVIVYRNPVNGVYQSQGHRTYLVAN